MRAVLVLFLFLGGAASLRAQITDDARAQQGVDPGPPRAPGHEHHDELTLRLGYHQGRYGAAEAGIGRSIYGIGHLPYGAAMHAGVEVRVDRPDLVGYKVGVHVSVLFAFGLQYVRYVEAGNGMDVLRPELGLDLGKVKFTYAYNLRLSKPELEGVSTHMLSLTYDLRLLRLRGDDARRMER
jgi:hypothetical protein